MRIENLNDYEDESADVDIQVVAQAIWNEANQNKPLEPASIDF